MRSPCLWACAVFGDVLFPLLLYVVSPDQRLLVTAWAEPCHRYAEILYGDSSVSLWRQLSLVLSTYTFSAASRDFLRGNKRLRTKPTSSSSSPTWECGCLTSPWGILPTSHHNQAEKFQLGGKCPERSHPTEEFYFLLKCILR